MDEEKPTDQSMMAEKDGTQAGNDETRCDDTRMDESYLVDNRQQTDLPNNGQKDLQRVMEEKPIEEIGEKSEGEDESQRETMINEIAEMPADNSGEEENNRRGEGQVVESEVPINPQMQADTRRRSVLRLRQYS